jgi:hypothetical protein
MIRVSMEVREGATLSTTTVLAGSIHEAVSITRGRYPGRDVRLMFPIDPEGFFIEGPASPQPEGNGRARLSAGGVPMDEGELDSWYSPFREER